MSEYNRENHHDEHHDDIARLKEQLAEQDARGLRLAAEVEHADAEVKRLNDIISGLRESEADLREMAHAERAEVEQLRERGDWAVEQLRLAEAAGEELREQLSLNRIHDRDCVAREAEVERLRAEVKEQRENRHIIQTHNKTLNHEVERLRKERDDASEWAEYERGINALLRRGDAEHDAVITEEMVRNALAEEKE